MYTIAWNNGVDELCGIAKSVIQFATLLERQQIQFTVSTRCGKCTQQSFGCGNFTHWVQDFS